MIEQSVIDAIIQRAEQGGLDEALLSQLRSLYPGVHFTSCMDDDVTVNAKAVAERATFKLYLVNSSQHCSVLTNDPASASGIVLAHVVEQ